MRLTSLALATVAMIAITGPAAAAVTTLPAIVNLSGTNTAPSAYQSTVSFAAGSYTVSLIGIADGGTFDALAVATPSAGNWVDYYKYTIAGVSKFFDPLGAQRYGTAALALAAYRAQPQLQFNFATATDVTFAVGDDVGQFGDNAGGTSLRITSNAPAVPEPATWAMMIVGFGLAGASLRSTRKSTNVVAA